MDTEREEVMRQVEDAIVRASKNGGEMDLTIGMVTHRVYGDSNSIHMTDQFMKALSSSTTRS